MQLLLDFFRLQALRSLSCVRSFANQASTSHLNTAAPNISFNKIGQLSQRWEEVGKAFREHGYVILTPGTSDRQMALKACRLFGKIQSHIRAPENGVVEVRSESLGSQGKQVVSNLAFDAHTDGAYLEGMAFNLHGVYRVGPPKIVALQCVKPAFRGGESFLVDGRAILLAMLEKDPHLISTLFSRHCMSICREDHLVMDLPVFRKHPSGNLAMRFSYDRDMYAPKWAAKNLAFFNQNYILNQSFKTYISLSERQILVFDNHRHLHGRTEIEGERLFRRIWVQDEDISEKMITPKKAGTLYFGSRENATHALGKYQNYSALEQLRGRRKLEKMPIGIDLPPQAREKLAKLQFGANSAL